MSKQAQALAQAPTADVAVNDGAQPAALRAAMQGVAESGPRSTSLPVNPPATAQEKAANADLTGPQKAAIILATLGRDSAKPVLQQLSDDELRHFAHGTAQLGHVTSEMHDATLKDFISALAKQRVFLDAGKLKDLLSTILSDSAIERIIEDMSDSDGRSVWEKVSHSDPADLVTYLSHEHPQTVSVVMSRIKPDMAAKVMARLEPDFAEEVVLRLANVSALGAAVMVAVKDSIETDFLRNARLKSSKRKPDEMIGAIFNLMPSDRRDSLMGRVVAKDAALASAVQRKMFTFSDVPTRVERADVGKILREVDLEVLFKALKFAAKNAAETPDFVLGSISKRLAEQYTERLSFVPEPNQRDGEEAQFEVINVIRRMAETGEISLRQPDEDDV